MGPRGERTRAQGFDPKATQFLVDYLYTLVYVRLARDYEMVTSPGPSTLRVRLAYTKSAESDVELAMESTTNPQPNLIPQFKKVAQRPPRFVGDVTVEAAIRDSQTGTLFWAGIEQKLIESAETAYTWDDLEADLKFDSERLGYRLCQARGDTCPRPVRGR